jgi:hypothetical protein
MAVRITSSASSLEARSGAKPPSSPTAVALALRAESTFFSEWKTSTPMRSPSEKLGARPA